jgi:hypothetical protein
MFHHGFGNASSIKRKKSEIINPIRTSKRKSFQESTSKIPKNQFAGRCFYLGRVAIHRGINGMRGMADLWQKFN